jgi:hypothetical protein
MRNKGQMIILGEIAIFCIAIITCYLLFWYLPHFSTGWDTGIMTGTIIGFDSNLFGTKTVFVLEQRTVFEEGKGLSQSQIKLCSDYDDTNIHELVQKYINKKVIIEYKERRVGYYPFKYCHEAPITNIILFEEEKK